MHTATICGSAGLVVAALVTVPLRAQTAVNASSQVPGSVAGRNTGVDSPDGFVGKFKLFESNLPQLGVGKMDVTRQGDVFLVNFDFEDGNKWRGVAAAPKANPGELRLAAGPTGAVALGIYEAPDRVIAARWIPLAGVSKGPTSHGREVIVGATDYKGSYRVTSGNFPMSGIAYTGTLAITAFNSEGFDLAGGPRLLSWSVAGRTMPGVGMVIDDRTGGQSLVAAAGGDKMFFAGRMMMQGNKAVRIEFCGSNRTTGYMLLEKLPQ